MNVRYQDYYAVLGVARTATQDEIRRAYRQLARRHHPDVDSSAGATARFQRITEAYEVLKDPATRQRYDTLGPHWKEGQDFTPPPGWGRAPHAGAAGPRARRSRAADEDAGAFSSFFESLFRGGGFEAVDEELAGRGRRARAAHERAGRDIEAELTVPLATALRGGTAAFSIDDGDGIPRSIEVRVPAGSHEGTVLRLRGQGQARADGARGDLLLRLALELPPGFEVGADGSLRGSLAVAPHEAVLGARVPWRGPDGAEGRVSVPAGSSSGRVLRLRGQGLPLESGGRGDLELAIRVVVPEHPTEAERRAYEALARALAVTDRTGPAERPTS